jgi:hypothetical protein
MKITKVFSVIFIMYCCAFTGFTNPVTLKTNDLDECIGISSFLSNNKDEVFLFSWRTHKIFKFNSKGDFEKSFCRYGIGPGEIKRVLYMFHNPHNDFLYLPEAYSGLARVSIFDGSGNFKNYLDIELTENKKDHIKQLIFLADGSFYAVISKRVGWEPRGKIYLTRVEFSVLYFDKNGKLKAPVYQTFMNDEVADRPRMGGPRLLFYPAILARKTPEGNICICKSDENQVRVYSKTGSPIGSITLEMERLLLSDAEFEKAKAGMIEGFKEGSRMRWLAERMIKLKYKPLYEDIRVFPGYYVTFEREKDEDGYTKETILTFFDKTGKRKSIKKINGLVMNIAKNRLYIKEYDEDKNEAFRIETLNRSR